MRTERLGKYTGEVSATVAYVRKISKKLAMPQNGNRQVIVKKQGVNCVHLSPIAVCKWMCTMLMATEIMFLLTI